MGRLEDPPPRPGYSGSCPDRQNPGKGSDSRWYTCQEQGIKNGYVGETTDLPWHEVVPVTASGQQAEVLLQLLQGGPQLTVGEPRLLAPVFGRQHLITQHGRLTKPFPSQLGLTKGEIARWSEARSEP